MNESRHVTVRSERDSERESDSLSVISCADRRFLLIVARRFSDAPCICLRVLFLRLHLLYTQQLTRAFPTAQQEKSAERRTMRNAIG